MYDFAIVALLGLVTLKLAQLLEEWVPALSKVSLLVRLGIGVGAAFAIDYSMFEGFGIAVREAWLGTMATGLAIGSLTTVWRVALGWLGASEDDVPTEHHHRPRMAA